jgi:MinD superfamily P-loop ATPase
MIVAVASGKGGTGKTTVAASLATIWDGPVLGVDLDVEEPNLHLFLSPPGRCRERNGPYDGADVGRVKVHLLRRLL